ncbi:hypothetical protein DEO72_LG5g1873 [Vigna unguiculata]|uniref:Uncharacterized protein n=1 Tax=Vigna unguiculata TaxID=3917 RepID=A0A4D6LYN3_VIGUN|nr:hypothetical protein DEO72_LG5g1873 [Vigna unguiculata]
MTDYVIKLEESGINGRYYWKNSSLDNRYCNWYYCDRFNWYFLLWFIFRIGLVYRVHDHRQTHADRPTTEQGNLFGPIRTGHNQHTRTGNTRQPEPQLKGSLCSSAIPSHNSRDVIPSHNSRNTTCLTPMPSHNSRDMFRATTQGTQQTHL